MKVFRDESMVLKMSSEEKSELEQAAAKSGMSMSTVVRLALRDFYNQLYKKDEK